MKLIMRSTLFALFVISSFLLLATAPVSIFIESNPYLSSWPRTTIFLYAAVAGIISNAKASFLLPIHNFSGFRFLHQITVAAIAIAVLVGLGGYVPAPPRTFFPINIEHSWPFIIASSFCFIGYLLMSLFSTEDDDESTQDEEQYCLKQSWPARPFAPFWLHSLTATRRALVVRQPTMFRNNVQNIAYTNIANVKTIGYWLPICKVEVNSLNGDIHVVVNKMPRRKAEHFAEVVMARVDFVGRASSNIAIHHPSLHKQQSNKQPEVQPLEKTEQFTDENDMEDQRDFKQERMRHTRLQNKGKRQ